MSTITAVLEADADGTLHVPLPEELRGGKVKVVATLEAASSLSTDVELTARQKKGLQALHWLQKRGTFQGVDAVAWQREIRKDRPLPGREE